MMQLDFAHPTKDNNTDMGEIKQIRLVVSCARGTLLRKMLLSVLINIFISCFDSIQIDLFVFFYIKIC
jgi:hypothetical protein